MQDPYKILLNYSFRLLSGKSYTESEISTKLKKRSEKVKLEDVPNLVAKVITRLKELNYLNDDQILSDYFEYRLRARPHGKFSFLHAMHRRGIGFETARAAWEKRGVEEAPLAIALLEQKKRKLEKLPDVLRKKKIAQLLASRGFSPETVWGILDKTG